MSAKKKKARRSAPARKKAVPLLLVHSASERAEAAAKLKEASEALRAAYESGTADEAQSCYLAFDAAFKRWRAMQ